MLFLCAVQYVLGLQISVHNIVGMEISDGFENRSREEADRERSDDGAEE